MTFTISHGYQDATLRVTDRVDDLVGRMTLVEKVTQMLCVSEEKLTTHLKGASCFESKKAHLHRVGSHLEVGGSRFDFKCCVLEV